MVQGGRGGIGQEGQAGQGGHGGQGGQGAHGLGEGGGEGFLHFGRGYDMGRIGNGTKLQLS